MMFPEEFVKAGKSAEMEQRYRDPRYMAAVMRRLDSELPARPVSLRQAAAALPRSSMGMSSSDPNCKNDRRWRGHCDDVPAPADANGVIRDWSNVLGGGADGQGGNGVQGMFPAKYNFDIFAPPSCSNDFVVYPTNAAGATQSGTEQEHKSNGVALSMARRPRGPSPLASPDRVRSS